MITDIIDYKLSEHDVDIYFDITYLNDIHCGEKAIAIKKAQFKKYFSDNNKKSILIKYILFTCNHKVLDMDTNTYITGFKKGLRGHIVGLDGREKYLPVHITDYEKDSLFLENLVRKLNTGYKKIVNGDIIGQTRNLNNIQQKYNLILNISKKNNKQISPVIYGTNHRVEIRSIISSNKAFHYQFCLTEEHGLRNLLDNRSIYHLFSDTLNDYSDAVEVFETDISLMNNVYDDLKIMGFKRQDINGIDVLVSDTNTIIVFNDPIKVGYVEKYIFSQSQKTLMFGLKNMIQTRTLGMKQHLEQYYDIKSMFWVKAHDKEKLLKHIYKKDWNRSTYRKDIIKTWGDCSVWITVGWNAFNHFANTSFTKLLFRRYNGNIIHAIDYPNEYNSLLHALVNDTTIRRLNYNTNESILSDLTKPENKTDDFIADGKTILHKNNRSLVCTDFNIVLKQSSGHKDSINSEKYGLCNVSGSDNCIQFTLIDNQRLITNYCGIPLHGWTTPSADLFRLNKFKFNKEFGKDFVNDIMISIRKLSKTIHQDKIYHNDIQSYNLCIDQDARITLIDCERYGCFPHKIRRYTYGSTLNKLHEAVFTSPLYAYLCVSSNYVCMPFIDFEEYEDVKKRLRQFHYRYTVNDDDMTISYNINVCDQMKKYKYSDYKHANIFYKHLKYMKHNPHDKYTMKIFNSDKDIINIFPFLNGSNRYYR